MSNVINLFANRAVSNEAAYKTRLSTMSKVELLEEMVRFQEERKMRGELTQQMMHEGRLLFKALEDCADSQELKILSRSYRAHLERELNALTQERSQ